ncbi:MAG: glycosyltransferase family 2 protein [Clostridia bacterium]|nr:glycosyltransferase family 2 protein [Clostridia bacterium]
MGYFEIITLVFLILSGIFSLMLIHFAFFGLIGLFAKKTFPHTDKKLKYGIIVSARNEAAVIGNLIKSVQKNDYPQDKLQIFVVAHNCTDDTAAISRDLGATVYEYNNPNERTKGYAFKYLFKRIEEDFGIESYDGFLVLDADNILTENYMEKMNDAFVAGDCKDVITSFRNSKNFGSNLMSACYGIYFINGCRLESRGRTALGCSTRVQGTGYLISSKCLKDGWDYVTLTEDWEFTADQILQDTKIVFCDDAMFYDEQPTTFKVMWNQRVRWAKGHLLVFLTRFKDLVKGFFKPKSHGGTRKKGSTYDIFVNILPVCVISTTLFILYSIFFALTPVFDPTVNMAFLLKRHLIVSGITTGTGYLTLVITSLVVYIIEHKRIKGISLGMKILSSLVWPIFIFLATPCEFVALFTKNLAWKPIPHVDTTDIEKIKALNEGETATEEKVAEVENA